MHAYGIKLFEKGYIDCNVLVREVDPWLIMTNNVICVLYVYGCIFWFHLKYYINKVMKYFVEDENGWNNKNV